jgi:hypothetical protein
MAEPGQSFRKLRRTAGLRNVLIGTAAAFVGGGMVVALQAVLARAGASYPPIIQGLHCNFAKPAASDDDGTGEAELGEGDVGVSSVGSSAPDAVGRLLPEVEAGSDFNCYLDAPGADYAAWAVAGRRLQFRSGPLDPALTCQDAKAFSAQSPDDLRLSACQTFRLTEPGQYRLVMKVLARGFGSVDREDLLFVVRPKPARAPQASEPPVATRLKLSLILPGQHVTQMHKIPVSESLSEHGLLPTTRDYAWTVYKLGPAETYVSSRFQANSASNASRTNVSYQPKTRRVTISFTLRSGPFVDRWRGWISGSVAVQVQRQDAARTVDLPDADLRVPGQLTVALPDELAVERLSEAKIHFVRSETGAAAEAALGRAAVLDNAEITARVQDGALVVEADKVKGK